MTPGGAQVLVVCLAWTTTISVVLGSTRPFLQDDHVYTELHRKEPIELIPAPNISQNNTDIVEPNAINVSLDSPPDFEQYLTPASPADDVKGVMLEMKGSNIFEKRMLADYSMKTAYPIILEKNLKHVRPTPRQFRSARMHLPFTVDLPRSNEPCNLTKSINIPYISQVQKILNNFVEHINSRVEEVGFLESTRRTVYRKMAREEFPYLLNALEVESNYTSGNIIDYAMVEENLYYNDIDKKFPSWLWNIIDVLWRDSMYNRFNSELRSPFTWTGTTTNSINSFIERFYTEPCTFNRYFPTNQSVISGLFEMAIRIADMNSNPYGYGTEQFASNILLFIDSLPKKSLNELVNGTLGNFYDASELSEIKANFEQRIILLSFLPSLDISKLSSDRADDKLFILFALGNLDNRIIDSDSAFFLMTALKELPVDVGRKLTQRIANLVMNSSSFEYQVNHLPEELSLIVRTIFSLPYEALYTIQKTTPRPSLNSNRGQFLASKFMKRVGLGDTKFSMNWLVEFISYLEQASDSEFEEMVCSFIMTLQNYWSAYSGISLGIGPYDFGPVPWHLRQALYNTVYPENNESTFFSVINAITGVKSNILSSLKHMLFNTTPPRQVAQHISRMDLMEKLFNRIDDMDGVQGKTELDLLKNLRNTISDYEREKMGIFQKLLWKLDNKFHKLRFGKLNIRKKPTISQKFANIMKNKNLFNWWDSQEN